jgi:cobaltochelatase CobN
MSVVSRALLLGLCLLLPSLASTRSARAQTVDISILPGDSYSEIAVNAVKALVREHPEWADRLRFHLYPSKDVRTLELEPLRRSRLVLLNVHQDHFVQEMSPELEAVMAVGGRVYALGTTRFEERQREMGIVFDAPALEYYEAGGLENFKNLLRYLLRHELGLDVDYAPVAEIPRDGIFDHRTGALYAEFEEFRAAYGAYRAGAPWIGVTFFRNHVVSGQTLHVEAVIDALETGGYNVLPAFGFPEVPTVSRLMLDAERRSRVAAIVSFTFRLGVDPVAVGELFEQLGVPVINAVSLISMSESEWRESPVGIDVTNRTMQLGNPELGGLIQPTVVASKERVVDEETGMEYIEIRPIAERVRRVVERVERWVALQQKPNEEKRVAIVYYNYPPGRHNIGASYLNVLPGSLHAILERLAAEGYDVGGRAIDPDTIFDEVRRYGRNLGDWAPGELERLVESRRPVLVPLGIYREWFAELPEALRASVLETWGEPEASEIMTWRDARGNLFFVLPAVRYGNIVLTAQPLRAVGEDAAEMYHDAALPPHHQYIAFYLFLQRGMEADAVVHLGTHGTHEWLSGKEAGFSDDDAPEALIAGLPNIYPYIVDNVGEGTQAKRRGMAVIIDHMTPPFNQAGLNPELRELAALINDYTVAVDKSTLLPQIRLAEINALAGKIGILTDLGLEELRTEDDVEELEHHIKHIGEARTPFGLHTFGRAPEARYVRSTAEAIASVDTTLSGAAREALIVEIEGRIRLSAERELGSLVAALAGRYIPAGKGNDPIRNPESLPTGKNFYSFDAARVPSRAVYEQGAALARELIEGYRERHGVYPDRLSFVLWSTETMRHEGVMESQIMHLMGVRPRWDARGRVDGIEVIPRAELGRPRVDVTITPSGLYRDIFPNLMLLIDQGVTLAREQTEADNVIRRNVEATAARLVAEGVDSELAQRLASVRMFSVPTGAYGTGVEERIMASDQWEDEAEIAGFYLGRMSHLYGQGFWGEKAEDASESLADRRGLSVELFRGALQGTRIAVHSRSGNVYASLDNDDFFQYLGGMAMAIRAIDGATPEINVTNLSDPNRARQESLARFMGREMRARYLNPEWITAMLDEGYSGARFVNRIVQHLWGWQVTTPEVVDAAKWQEMYETYVLDRHGLGIRERFREAGNLEAYQSMVARMLEVARREYWTPDDEVLQHLARELATAIAEVGMNDSELVADNAALREYVAETLAQGPAAELAERIEDARAALQHWEPAPAAAPLASTTPRSLSPVVEHAMPSSVDDGTVTGREMEQRRHTLAPRLVAHSPGLYTFGFLVLLLAFLVGWIGRRRRWTETRPA